MAISDKPQKLTFPDMLKKLDELYDKKDAIENSVKNIYNSYEQTMEDIEFLELMIMYMMNTKDRKKNGNDI